LDAVQLLLVLLVLAIVVAVVTAPLRRPPAPAGEEEERASADVAALEAAKEAKYREIRDAELDHRTGKLSDADWREIDRRLRAEAVEILRRLDEAGG
jgi:flagellar biosynthesis/type III secretory pathway M-ring protein FliF/YscJ